MESMIMRALGILVTAIVIGASTGELVAQSSSGPEDGAEMAQPATPAAWFVEHNAFLTREGGRWITDNAEYQSENEPFDAYGLEWRPGLGGKTLTGRLFGLQDGKEVGTFWEFRIVWHPGEGRAYVHQFGSDGTYGVGTMEPVEDGQVRIMQDFFNPDGTRIRVGHDSTQGPGEWIHDQSYDIAKDGAWTERRSYDWKLTPGGG